MRIAITGASGHIGLALCQELLKQGYSINALYHHNAQELQKMGVDCIQGNILHKQDLSRLMEGAEMVIHSAAQISIHGDPDGSVFRINTEGTKNVMEAAIEQGLKRMVHISSVHAVQELPHSEPFTENRPFKSAADYAYDYSKAISEHIVGSNPHRSLEAVIVRPSCVIGPFDYRPSAIGAALLKLVKGKMFFLPAGGYNLVDVRDVAQSIVAALTQAKDREVFLLSGHYITFRELARLLETITGRGLPKIIIPFPVLDALEPMIAAVSRISGTPASLTRESIDAVRNGHPRMDHDKASQLLGHQPRPLSESLQDFITEQRKLGKI